MPLYELSNAVRRCQNFEYRSDRPGDGARENRGFKGHAYDRLPAGERVTLLDAAGPGVVDHIWITFKNREEIAPAHLQRALRLEAYWDGAKTPAVACPLGDFFGGAFGEAVSFENELFSSPGGKCFNCFIPMPFLKRGRIELVNESDEDINQLFYTVNYRKQALEGEKIGYFHAYWSRTMPPVGQDVTILPQVEGAGRFLGCAMQVATHPRYGGAWWGEGEVKAFIDGDGDFPSWLCTGTEDYPATAWLLNPFAHRYTGCLLCDEAGGRFQIYRLHVPDPIYFNQRIRVQVQQIGGWQREKLKELFTPQNQPQVITAINMQDGSWRNAFAPEQTLSLFDEDIPGDSWMNFLRQDDWACTAWFYLDRPENGLPALQAYPERNQSLFEKQ